MRTLQESKAEALLYCHCVCVCTYVADTRSAYKVIEVLCTAKIKCVHCIILCGWTRIYLCMYVCIFACFDSAVL